MASRSYFPRVFSLCVVVTLLYPFSCNAQYFFIFGDSLYDPGNNKYITGEPTRADYPPYGTTFFRHSTGRFSDGRLIPDFIAMKMNLRRFIPAALDPKANFVNGANFASAGSGVFESNNNVMSFGEQVEKFKNLTKEWREKFGSPQVQEALKSAVYLISIGGNDYFSFFTNNSNANVTQQKLYVDLVLAKFTSLVKEIYDIGARKFMIQNVAPLGCYPLTKQSSNLTGDACLGKYLTITKLHNAALPQAMGKLQGNLTGFIYSIFDIFTATGNRINNPTAYGFKQGDVACCGVGSYRGDDCGTADVDFELCYDPNEFLFFDGGHCTDKANSQMAELLWNGQEDVVSPFNMGKLFQL